MGSGRRALVLVVVALAAAAPAAGCGDDEESGIDEAELRGCLADAGIQVDSAFGGTGLVPGAAAPDFRASRGSEQLDVTVESSEERARRRAADIRSALVTYGVADPDRRLLTERNATVLFDRDPNPDTASTVRSCLG
jgi:hypothetical protein